MLSLFSSALLLFLVMDPVGNIPLFLCLLKGVPPERRRRVIIRELLIALAILVVFLFAGQYVLHFLGISEPSLSIAGGIILFLIAINMIFHGSEKSFGECPAGEPFIVPLAIPLLAGPSAMTTVLLLMAREPSRWLEWLLALAAAWFASGCILLASNTAARLLGDRGLLALDRMMGMLLTTLAVEMFIRGLRQLYP